VAKTIRYLSQSGTEIDLLDNITTDHITRIKDVLLLEPESIKASFLKGLGDLADREWGGDILVAGESFGIGSSRENAAEALALNGYTVVLAKSFGPIFKDNLINHGVFPTTNFGLLPLWKADEEVRFDELTAGLSMIQKRILSSGGLSGYLRAVSEGKEDLPQDLLIPRENVPQTSVEKLLTWFSRRVHQTLHDRSTIIPLKEGDSAIVQADYLVGYDVFFAHALRILEREYGGRVDFANNQVFLFSDHFGGSDNPLAQMAVKRMREYVAKHLGVTLAADGVYNKVMPRALKPGSLVVGMDSHTPELGIVPGSLAVPVGYSAFAGSLAGKGLLPLTVPASIKLHLNGVLPGHTDIKDALWTLVREYFAGSLGNGCVFEIGGEGFSRLDYDEAAKVFNMVTEFGGIGAVGVTFNPQVYAYLHKRGTMLADYAEADIAKLIHKIGPDDEATYRADITFDLGSSKPCLVGPATHKRVIFIEEMSQPIAIDRVIYNSCAGSSLFDLSVLAAVLSNEARPIPVDIHLTDPLTRMQAEECGLLYELEQSGVRIDTTHSCGPCMGMGAKVGNGETVVSTNNRNYPGRMGDEQGVVYLGSSVVAALTAKLGRTPTIGEVVAVEGRIYQAREKLRS
jgi:3-isopropylmalate/(R)-2-methylmalate dehydratase large subunit